MTLEYVSAVAGALGGLLAIVLAVLGLSTFAIGYLLVVILVKREWIPIVYNVRSLMQRRVTTLLTAAGLALVVFVFTTIMMFAAGISHTLVSTGDPGTAKILRKGAESEIASDVSREQLRVLANFPEIAAGRDGKPLVSYELVVLIFALKERFKDESDGANLSVRAVTPAALELHPLADLEGRMFRTGTNEIVIGRALAGRFEGATLGGSMKFARRSRVVGIASHDGNAFDSEVWGDLDAMENAFNRRPVLLCRGGPRRDDYDARAGHGADTRNCHPSRHRLQEARGPGVLRRGVRAARGCVRRGRCVDGCGDAEVATLYDELADVQRGRFSVSPDAFDRRRRARALDLARIRWRRPPRTSSGPHADVARVSRGVT